MFGRADEERRGDRLTIQFAHQLLQFFGRHPFLVRHFVPVRLERNRGGDEEDVVDCEMRGNK